MRSFHSFFQRGGALWVALLFCGSVGAIDQIAFTDSLRTYCQPLATVGSIHIQRIEVRKGIGSVFCTPNIAGLPLSPQVVDDLHSIAYHFVFADEIKKGQPAPHTLPIRVFSNGYEISELIENHCLPDSLKGKPYQLHKVTPLVQPLDFPYPITQGLDSIHLVVYGSHGLYFNQKRENWQYQRARLFTTVEDVYTSSYTMPFLVPMLEKAGAVVLQPRERDPQPLESVIDESDSDFCLFPNGAWKHTSQAGFGHKSTPLLEGQNPFQMGGYASLPATTNPNKAQTAVYFPQLEKEGQYGVYVSYKTVENSSDEVVYTVFHKGQATHFQINQQMGGSTWIYLGHFAFDKTQNNDPNNCIVISNQTKTGKGIVTTDAIKVGGGMGSVARYNNGETMDNTPSSKSLTRPKKHTQPLTPPDTTNALTSGYPRYMEGARYWLQYAGVPDSVYNFCRSQNDYTDDYTARGRWANWLAGGSEVNPDSIGLHIPVHFSLAFHTDAGNRKNDDIIGTLLIYTPFNNDKKETYPTGTNRLIGREYADFIQTQLTHDIRTTFAPEWTRRMLWGASYSECRNPEMPSAILELLSHHNFADMRYGLDPSFRFVASRAIYKGMLRFLHAQYGTPAVVQPLPIQAFQMELDRPHHHDGSDSVRLHLRWQDRTDALESTAVPRFYILYTRTDNSDWDNGRRIEKTNPTGSHLAVMLQKGVRYDFKVAAANEGGLSFDSEILSAYIAPNETGRVLIINGFERVGAPESFAVDTLAGGFRANSFAVPYNYDIAFIGPQNEFNRSLPWRSDDDPGFGTSDNQYAGQKIVGNTFDYPVQHGKALAKMGISYISCSAKSVRTIDDQFQAVDWIVGKQKQTKLGTIQIHTDFEVCPDNLIAALTQYTQKGGNLLVSGAYLGSQTTHSEAATPLTKHFAEQVLHLTYLAPNGTANGQIRFAPSFHCDPVCLYTTPNSTAICCEQAQGLKPVGKNSEWFARYQDSGICAGIRYKGQYEVLAFGFPLESVQAFEPFYQNCIRLLVQPQNQQ